MAIVETEVVEAEDTEQDRVVRWRVEQLLDAGYDGESALVIGLDASIDLHHAVRLMERGCPRDTALRILF
jgi:hypothetical protein